MFDRSDKIEKQYEYNSVLIANGKLGSDKQIDYIRLHDFQTTDVNHAFDMREIWDLNLSIAYLLYPRICYFAEVGDFWFNSDGRKFYKKVLKPIIKALEYQIEDLPMLVRAWQGWTEKDIRKNHPKKAYDYVNKQIYKGYKLLALYHGNLVT